jgi:fructosamine-3-kinase
VDPSVRAAVARLTGVDVARATVQSGGDVARAHRVELADGTTVFAKDRLDGPAECFVTEAAGLEWLRASGATPIPRVLGVDTAPPVLVLEWVPAAPVARPDEPAFGRALASLHRSGAPCFGREDRRPTGSLGVPNDPTDTWVEFFRDRRLLPLAALAERRGALAAPTIEALRSVADRLDELGGPPEAPARLHGDLWAGNRLVDATGRSWLIDPAAHGGHREFDLAMMRLFGGFGAAAFDAYDREHPLADGWQDRVALHQLAPLVVHAIKFGGSYVGAVRDALDRIG